MKAIFNHIKGDRVIWIIVLLLSVVSILAVYSSVITLAYRSKSDQAVNYFLIKHIIIILFGFLLIFVTHNANIPVLGEADRVVVMKMENPNQSGVPDAGNIDTVKDKILSLLEGGADAFRMRQAKYGSLLNKPNGT